LVVIGQESVKSHALGGHEDTRDVVIRVDGPGRVALKGTVAVVAAFRFGPDTAIMAGLGAFLGHCFPVWLKFRGGKGVATYLGVLLGFHWPALLAAAAVWLAAALLTRYSSLGALLASAATPAILLFAGYRELAELFLLLTIILWIQHRANIRRLVTGKEHRIERI
jgi:glycerol-3-phosphate acyltransferase PlsY